jgi:hypothetical protein
METGAHIINKKPADSRLEEQAAKVKQSSACDAVSGNI